MLSYCKMAVGTNVAKNVQKHHSFNTSLKTICRCCVTVDIPTLPEKLREAGYATHIVGKWHLGYYKEECHPLNRGFDSFYGILTGKGDHYTHNNTAYIDGHILNGYDFWKNHDPDFSADGHYSTFLYQDRINQLIDDHDRSKPLFMYVPFQAVHSPLQVPDSYCLIYHNITELKRQRFAGMTTCMDEAVGNIVNKLKGSGLWRNTVLIFSTDNGGSVLRGGNNWPLRGWKNSMWEGAVRAVGFVLSDLLPTNVRGTTSKQLMDISDWFPTLVQGVAGHSIEGLDLDGYDMWDVLRSQVESPRLELVHNIDPWPNNPAKFSTEISAAIRVRDWKLITGDPGSEGGKWIAPSDYNITPDQPLDPEGKKIWLFNITADPCEKVDLSNHHPEIVESLLDKLKGYYQNSISPFHPPETIQADPQLRGGLWRAWA
ncbi:arylsulfatase J-like isoform X2 [Apostichopus japonicus]|uniref:arylsulfatase J-like isoform X2 n=1 Tax=Stichopus japonicus TaxID=307972 RepID=UPI003AB21203